MGYDRVPDQFPVLRSAGLVLRELDEEDLPAWLERLSDREAAAQAGDSVATSMQDVIDGLAHHRQAFRARTGLRWAIVPDEIGASVGSIGVERLDFEHRSAEIGAAIGRVHWSRGYATRAGRLVIDYGFGTLGLERVEAQVLASNAAVIRVLDKLGFEREGLLHRHRVVDGVRRDFAIYSALR